MIARKWRIALVTAVTSMAATAGLTTTLVAHAAVGCQVAYSVQNQWQGGFGANVTVTNLGDPLTSWRLTWSFTAGQTITQLWNGSHTQSGSQVTVSNVSYNGNLPTNGSTSFGFNGASSASNPQPASFALNGVTCTGGTTGNPTGGPTAGPTSSSPRPPTPSASPTGGNTGGGTGTTCNTAPVNPNATPAARRLLCLVVNTYGRGILSGQQESTWIGGPEYEMNHIQNTTGKLPAIRGLDMGDSPNFGSRAVAWWNAGGIPMVGYHMGSPSNSADGYASSRMGTNLNNALTNGTTENTRLRQRLDAAAAQLQQVQAVGGAVIWRPYHEAGGTWFWWSMEGGALYNRLWRYTYDYMTNTKGLNNLVWLHGYNGQPNASFYPGKQYVDIGGADTYVNNFGPLTAMYNQSRNIYGTTLPIALHENGPIPDPNQLQSAGSRWVLFGTWHGTHLTSSNPAAHLRMVYNHAYVITRDELPNLRG